MIKHKPLLSILLCLWCALSCGGAAESVSGEPSQGLLLAMSQFEVSAEGKVLPRPKAALLEVLIPTASGWSSLKIEDSESNVFHKAMVYDSGTGDRGILTLGGSAGALKLWTRGTEGFTAKTLWKADFGGKSSRMREAELLPMADGSTAIVVATHDQGVVAIVSPGKDGYSVRELDRKPSTFVHEIEIGDLDGDGNAEIYATPSDPNLFDGKPQSGVVVRYDPVKGSRKVVADLGDRHAKEILVTDLDGDGKDELYVSVEAVAGGQLEIRRYQAETPADEGQIVARLQDRLCRFLTAGDVDGDGKQELVAAANRSGLWLIRPHQGRGMWSKKLIDRDSSGFEHAALLVDLDQDGKHELYVASDDQGQVRRYRWSGEAFEKEVLQERTIPDAVFTWNLMPVPLDLVR
jgi:hypothetical protein